MRQPDFPQQVNGMERSGLYAFLTKAVHGPRLVVIQTVQMQESSSDEKENTNSLDIRQYEEAVRWDNGIVILLGSNPCRLTDT